MEQAYLFLGVKSHCSALSSIVSQFISTSLNLWPPGSASVLETSLSLTDDFP
jgi:hypothetical protein